jgi:hypothetical protein
MEKRSVTRSAHNLGSRAFSEQLINGEEDRTLPAMLVGMLLESRIRSSDKTMCPEGVTTERHEDHHARTETEPDSAQHRRSSTDRSRVAAF